jgi:hypothetical protein
MHMEVLHYLDEDGADPFQDWLDGLTDLRPGWLSTRGSAD